MSITPSDLNGLVGDLISEMIAENENKPEIIEVNRWNRLSRPVKSGGVLGSIQDRKLILEQFNTDPNSRTHRPIIFSKKVPAIAATNKQKRDEVEFVTGTSSSTATTPIKQRPVSAAAGVMLTPVKTPAKAAFAAAAAALAFVTPNGSRAQTPDLTSPFKTPGGQHKVLPVDMTTPSGTVLSSKRYTDFIDDDGVRKTLFHVSPERPKNAGESVHKRHVEQASLELGSLYNPNTSQNAANTSALEGGSPSVNSHFGILTRALAETQPIVGTVAPAHSDPTTNGSMKRKRQPGQKALANQAAAIKKNSEETIKGGQPIKITLCKRRRKDFPQQITVMGFSAKEAVKAEINAKKGIWDENKIKLMESLLHFSLEHLHCLAFSLAPADINPQVPANLGVGTSWINSFMMVLETVARDFSARLKGANEAVVVNSKFEMEGTLIKTVSYEILLKANGKELTIKNKVTVWALPDRHNWPSTTDPGRVKEVAEAILYSKPATRITTFALQTAKQTENPAAALVFTPKKAAADTAQEVPVVKAFTTKQTSLPPIRR